MPLTVVSSHVVDPKRCQAVVLSSDGRQCTAKATAKREGYPVCNRHKKARGFLLWTPVYLMSMADACRAFQRLILELRGDNTAPVLGRVK